MVDPSTLLRTGIVHETSALKPLRRKEEKKLGKTVRTEAEETESGEARPPVPEDLTHYVGAYS